MVGNAAVRLGHLSGIAAVGANIPAGMVIRVAALHNGYGSILIHLRQLDQCAVFLLIGIAPCQQGLVICVIPDFDAVKGAAGQGHWNIVKKSQFQLFRAAAGHGQRSLRVDTADDLAAHYHSFVPGTNEKPTSTDASSAAYAALQNDIVQRQLCACVAKLSNFHRVSGLGDAGASHCAVRYDYIGAEDAQKRLLTGFAQGVSIQVQYNIFADLDGVCVLDVQRPPQRDRVTVLRGSQRVFQTGVSLAAGFKCLHQRMAAGAVTGAVHLARMVADSAADTFAVMILVGMRDHLDRSIRNIYIGNVQNFVVIGVCKGISLRQQSQGLLTKCCIDSTLERAALELGFPEEIHLMLKHAVALYRQGKQLTPGLPACCNAV